ncbi:MAG TPA: DUF922 domain-containing protein [Chitinophagaceae bacterium]|jgi:hypothetical protein|nr:DUF922 domain-containing protein [Chitinophagaceae bacterium]
MSNHLPLFTLAAVLFLAPAPGTKTANVSDPEPIVLTEKKNNRIEDDIQIPWLNERRLTWDDFQCEPKRNTDAVASTSTSLGIAYQVKGGRLSYSVTCTFSKVKSWGLLKTEYILAHEQAHFDITELHARRLHEALEAYDFSKRNYKADVAAIYERIVKEKEAMQAAYDGETDHSRNRKIQFEWLAKIDTMLQETADYSAYP